MYRYASLDYFFKSVKAKQNFLQFNKRMSLQKNKSFFQIIHIRVHAFYGGICSSYMTLVAHNARRLISFYILFSFVSSLGLIYINVDMDSDSLALVRNSPSLRDAKILGETFGVNQHQRRN